MNTNRVPLIFKPLLRSHALRAILSLLILPLSTCTASEQTEGAEPPPVPVVVTEVRQETVPIITEYVARTEADSTVEIRARVEGVLEGIFFEDGSRVEKGQLLFQIEPAPYEAALQDARARLAKAEADLNLAEKNVELIRAQAEEAQAQARLAKADQDVERLRPLAKESAVPQQELDTALAAQAVAEAELEAAQASVQNTELTTETSILQAQAAVEGAKAAVIQAELDLAYTRIVSPIDGEIGRKLVDQGNLVGRGDSTVLGIVSRVEPIKALFSISETDYLKMARRYLDRETGEPKPEPEREKMFELILADDSVYDEKGWFSSVESVLDIETGTLTMETKFPNPRHFLRPNQFARIRFPVAELENALVVPQRAVLRSQGANTVYLVEADDKVVVRSIGVLGRVEENVLVSEGVAPGDRVILEGHQKVRPGMTVIPSASTESGEGS